MWLINVSITVEQNHLALGLSKKNRKIALNVISNFLGPQKVAQGRWLSEEVSKDERHAVPVGKAEDQLFLHIQVWNFAANK